MSEMETGITCKPHVAHSVETGVVCWRPVLETLSVYARPEGRRVVSVVVAEGHRAEFQLEPAQARHLAALLYGN
jgi:hypothetical protein